jgi:hypothetical protein
MANIRLKELIEANIDPKLVARSKESGKMVYFKTPQAKANAMKAGTHEDPKAKKGAQPKADAKPNNMFGKDYSKDRGAKTSKSNTNWMDDLDSIDTSDVKGKANPSADSWTHDDVFGATFKDPQTGKPISVGDAYDREDDSPAYQKAFAYVAQFNPDDEAVMGTQAYDDLQNKGNGDDWMADLDSIDVSDIKGKADPDADSFTSGDLYGATFKDPKTGKTITVGDAYEREDDSDAYKKAFAYVSKFDPDKEVVMGTQAYDDLNKKEAPKANLPKKASQLDYNHASSIADVVNAESGLDGYVDTDDNTDAIMYHGKQTGIEPTYTLYIGGNDDYGKPDEFRVSLESTYGNDPAKLAGKYDKSFKSGDDAVKYMTAIAKKHKKELQMDDGDKNESSKLTSMLKK